jgi:ParB-like chromosome segregation protein Spo0J
MSEESVETTETPIATAPEAEAAEGTEAEGTAAADGALEQSVLTYIPANSIEVPENLARFFAPDAKRLKELEDSIREQGLLEPIGVKQNTNSNGDSTDGGLPFILQYGQQRLSQFKKVFGEDADIAVLIRPDSADSLKDAAAENLGQTRLSQVERAMLVQRVRTRYDWHGPENTKKVAAFLKMSPAAVTQLEKISLLASTPALQKALHKDELAAESGFELARVMDPKLREQFFQRAKEIEVEAERARLAEAEAKVAEAKEQAAKIKADADASAKEKKKAQDLIDQAKEVAKAAAARVTATEKAGGQPKRVSAPAVRQALNEGGVKTTASKPSKARTTPRAAPGSKKSTTAATAAADTAPTTKQRNVNAWNTVVNLMKEPAFGSKRASKFANLYLNWFGLGKSPVTDEAFVAGLKAVFAD